MATNKIILKSSDEFQAGYTPVYRGIMPLFLPRSKAYAEVVGQHTFRSITTIGDIRGAHISPKDTEIKQISVAEGKKVFKKFFKATQYLQSTLQDSEGNEDVVKRVLDEHVIQQDEAFLTGEGSSNSTVINNGLLFSQDPNYITEDSTEVAFANRLTDLHTKIVATAEDARSLSGRKVMFVYGAGLAPLLNGIYADGTVPFKKVLQEVLNDFEIVQIPKAPLSGLSSANGWLAVNMEQIMLHYTQIAALIGQGVNEEAMRSWHNFLQGSTMLEVQTKAGIIHQPATLALS